MKLTVTGDDFPTHARILRQEVEERTKNIDGEMAVSLRVMPCGKDGDGYCIAGQGNHWEITGYGERGLYYGIGKFLHGAKRSKTAFLPQPTKGDVLPHAPFRAIYYSIHFYNWYQQAPREELEAYLTSLLLWGYNTVFLIVPVINLSSFEEPLFFDVAGRARSVFALCRKYGMETGIILGVQGLKTAPHDYDAELSYDPRNRGYLGRNLCPSKPAALTYLRGLWAEMLRAFSDTGIDYIMAWPYDEGGCGCANCRPWGAVGFCKAFCALAEEGKKIYPQAKFVLSTWGFDTVIDEGEFAGLYQKLQSGAVKTDFMLVDHHQEFPHYPLRHTPPVPVLNFPEISMWGLYPWGGFGANPLPRRFERLFRCARPVLRGGMPYSEGIYDDLLKVQCVGYYWQPDRHYNDIIAEYAGCYFPGSETGEIVRLCELIEQNHAAVYAGQDPDTAAFTRAAAIAAAQNKKILPAEAAGWRWRILYIRALLDRKRYTYYEAHKAEMNLTPRDLRHTAGDMLKDDAEAQALLWELCDFYHCAADNGENGWTHPPVAGADPR